MFWANLNAFEKTFISEFNFPNNLHTIGDFAFGETKLAEVSLPENLLNYAPSTFASCHLLENIYIDNNNKNYVDIDGVVYSKDLKTIH